MGSQSAHKSIALILARTMLSARASPMMKILNQYLNSAALLRARSKTREGVHVHLPCRVSQVVDSAGRPSSLCRPLWGPTVAFQSGPHDSQKRSNEARIGLLTTAYRKTTRAQEYDPAISVQEAMRRARRSAPP